MNTNSRLIIFLLSLATLGCALFAYREHSRQITGQNTVDALSKELAALRRRLQPMEKGPSPLQGSLSLGPVPLSSQTVKPGATSGLPMPDIRNDMGFGGGGFGNLMNNPEIQKLMSIQQRAALDTRYAGLFRQLHLNPVDLEKFKNLLVEKQTAAMDAMTAARQQGLSGPENRDALKQVIANAQTEVDNSIRSTLGEATFAEYQTYEQTLPERNLVTQLQQRLSYSTAPLSESQASQVIAILAANAPQPNQSARSPNGSIRAAFGFGFGPGQFGAGNVPVSDSVIAGSRSILNSTQIAALVQLQQEQQAQAQLAAQMRAMRQTPIPIGTGPGPGSGPVPTLPHP